jgi:hypothetical protein
MSFTTNNNGRLGNQIIRNLALSLIAKKYNLKVNYSNNTLITELGIPLYSGTNQYLNTIHLTDENYFNILNSDKLEYNLNPNNNYFQTKEIIQLLYNYLHNYEIKKNIIDKNVFNVRYNNNNDLFIHVRLGDVSHYNPGIHYYLNTIGKISSYDTMYIATDDINHGIIHTIINHYPNSKLIHNNEIDTIQFASTCKHVILSHGSFSAVIGYLSFNSTIYYPEYESNKIWYGDMFSIENWNKCSVLK